MKRFLLVLSGVAVIAGAFFAGRCSRTPLCENERWVGGDTVTVYDTVRFVRPEAVAERSLGSVTFRAPVNAGTWKTANADFGSGGACTGQAAMRHGIPTSAGTEAMAASSACGDSVDVEIPLTQRVYEDSTDGSSYRAWVSGFEPRLDSILVFPRREVVTIREHPKRWHLGATAGYGFTPHGMQPFVGVSVTYSILSW